jgi:hypothetical protein
MVKGGRIWTKGGNTMNIINTLLSEPGFTDEVTVEVVKKGKQIFRGSKYNLLHNSNLGDLEVIKFTIKGDALVCEIAE